MDSSNRRSPRSAFRMDGFKRRMVILVFAAGCICIGLNAFLFYAYVAQSYDLILQHSSLQPEIIKDRRDELFYIWLILTSLTVVTLVISAVWMLFVIHRVSGPIQHLRLVIANLQSGQLDTRLKLRQQDELQELAAEFNALIDELQSQR